MIRFTLPGGGIFGGHGGIGKVLNPPFMQKLPPPLRPPPPFSMIGGEKRPGVIFRDQATAGLSTVMSKPDDQKLGG